MRPTWLNHYRELQRRAEFKVRKVNNEIQQHQKDLSIRLHSLTSSIKFDPSKCLRQLGELIYTQQQALKKSPSLLVSSFSRSLHIKKSHSYSNVYSRIIRNPTYQRFERWWESSPCPGTVVLLGANTLIFLLWQISKPSKYDPINCQVTNPGLISTNFLQRHFTTSVSSIKEGRVHTLLTSSFSHRDGKHFVYSAITAYFMGSSLEILIGPQRLLLLYVVSGIFASLCQVISEAYRNRTKTQICGASGSLSAIMTTLAIKTPMQTVLLYGIVPVPMVVLVAAFLAYDVFNTGGLDNIGHEAHIGGAAAGALASYLYRFV